MRTHRRLQIAWLVLLLATSAQADYALDQPMTVAQLNGIDIAYTTAGNPDDPAVLLIAGLTASHASGVNTWSTV